MLLAAHVHLHGCGDRFGALDTLAVTVAASIVLLLSTAVGVYAGAAATMLLVFAIPTGALGQLCAALSLALAVRATAGAMKGARTAWTPSSPCCRCWRLTCGGIPPILSASPNP